MTSCQYEELCRYFVADQLKIPVEEVRSLWIPNPERERSNSIVKLEPFKHQIDLYWETGDARLSYINIANAKWRSQDLIRLDDVLLLQQVKIKVGAHKAILITNSGFTAQAQLAADDEGIGLLLVRPQFDTACLHATERSRILRSLQQRAGRQQPVYTSAIVRKGLTDSVSAADLLGPQPPSPAGARRAVSVPQALAAPAPPMPSPPVPAVTAPNSAYPTRQGPGPGFRTK